jgi:tetratricopeptide (TPR) repeat protein
MLGVWHMEQGRMAEALVHYEAASTLHDEVGQQRALGVTLTNMGVVLAHQDRVDDAMAGYERGLAIHRAVGNRGLECITLGNQGDLLRQSGAFADAARCLEAAVALGDETYPGPAGAFRGCLAQVRAEMGDIKAARRLLRRGEAQLRVANNAIELGKLHCRRGEVERLAGEAEAALAALAEAEAIAERVDPGEHSALVRAIVALREHIQTMP